jgi:hypothetical protein
MGFLIVGVLVIVVFCFRMRRLGERDRTAVVTAAFGLFLCARYSALIHDTASWVFVVGVGFLMGLLAYSSFNFRAEPRVEAR